MDGAELRSGRDDRWMWRSVCVDREDARKALRSRARLERVRVRLQEGFAKLARVQGKLYVPTSLLLFPPLPHQRSR